MTFKTKSRSLGKLLYQRDLTNPDNNIYTGEGSDSITYLLGPRYGFDGMLNWKPCFHSWIGHRHSPACYLANWWVDGDKREYLNNVVRYGGLQTDPGDLPIPSSMNSDLWSKVVDQIDLNCGESVLLYSGVLQAVPLLGSAMKFTSVLNRAARKLAKSFKRKPFTTVLKEMIQLDFIDRFVIKPTIDDARKFADATNYVLRKMQTMHERNMQTLTPIKSSISDRKVLGSGSARMITIPGLGDCCYDYDNLVTYTSEIFLLAELSYDSAAVDPIKLWASRVGLTKPLESVWDLVPFSFVVDYFTRAGEFISGLSQEMSSQEGLKGKIGRIHSCWRTDKHEWRREITGGSNEVFEHPYFDGQARVTFEVFRGIQTSSGSFQRYQLPNPFSYARQFWQQDFINIALSPTRRRTLLELVIQAKL